MLKGIEKAIKALGDTSAGWVTRQDGAEALGRAACDALRALIAHRDDKDVDVRRAVREGLERAGNPEAPPESAANETPKARRYSIEDLAKACEKPKRRKVSKEGGRIVVEVRTKKDRTQKVYLAPKRQKNGPELLRVFTYCGEPKPKVEAWVLRSNVRLPNCAFAVVMEEDREYVVLQRNFLLEEARPAEVKAAVKEVAGYGDWFENRLTGTDTF